MFVETTALKKILSLKNRIRGVAGGTSASKTISILQWIIDYAQTHENKVISVVSETMPHLRKGAIRDFKAIMQEQGYWKDACWNKTDSIYTFGTTIVEFFSADSGDKVRGPRRDVLFLNEGNNVSYETFTQLEIRTKSIIWIDWNPVSEFWFYTELKDKPNVDFIILTYRDNEALEESIIRSIESKRTNANFWKVYGLGQLGEIEGKIYNNWRIIDGLPRGARFEVAGLDFGFSNDPTAGVAIYYYDGWYILDELLYRLGLVNRQIAKLILPQLPKDHIVMADSAEPKSIAELTEYGLTVMGTPKGKDSVLYGIQLMQSCNIAVTKRSTNIIKEYRNYLWLTDKDGKGTNVPADVFNDCLDATRYGFTFIEPHIRFADVGTIGAEERKKAPTFVDGLDRDEFREAWAEAEEEVTRIHPRSW